MSSIGLLNHQLSVQVSDTTMLLVALLLVTKMYHQFSERGSVISPLILEAATTAGLVK
jgi:hypothetical protein